MERAILKGFSYVNGEQRDMKLVVFAAPSTGGRPRRRANELLSDIDGSAALRGDIKDILDTELPGNVDPA